MALTSQTAAALYRSIGANVADRVLKFVEGLETAHRSMQLRDSKETRNVHSANLFFHLKCVCVDIRYLEPFHSSHQNSSAAQVKK